MRMTLKHSLQETSHFEVLNSLSWLDDAILNASQMLVYCVVL